MKTIAICNQKGGVGKSTTTFHLARAGVRKHLRVLVIDMDPQGNITVAIAKEPLAEDTPGVADALSARTRDTLADVIVPSVWLGADLAPTVGEALAFVRDELVIAGAGREGRLRDAGYSARTMLWSIVPVAGPLLVMIRCSRRPAR